MYFINIEKNANSKTKRKFLNNYQLLHQYHKILAACNIQAGRACEPIFCGIDAITVLSYG